MQVQLHLVVEKQYYKLVEQVVRRLHPINLCFMETVKYKQITLLLQIFKVIHQEQIH